MARGGDPRRRIHLEDAVWGLRHWSGHSGGVLCGPVRQHYGKEIPRTLGEEVFSSPEPSDEWQRIRRGGLHHQGRVEVSLRLPPTPQETGFSLDDPLVNSHVTGMHARIPSGDFRRGGRRPEIRAEHLSHFQAPEQSIAREGLASGIWNRKSPLSRLQLYSSLHFAKESHGLLRY